MQKNRKTVEIPIGHSSARKQRAQNFFSEKKPEIGDRKVLYHNIIVAGRVRGGALCISQYDKICFLLLSRSGSSSTYEEFYKHGKEMEGKNMRKLNMFFLCYFCGLCERRRSKESSNSHRKRQGKVIDVIVVAGKWKKFSRQTPLKFWGRKNGRKWRRKFWVIKTIDKAVNPTDKQSQLARISRVKKLSKL
jgi:hypothetical protein